VKAKIEKLLDIPIVVVHEATPCKWKLVQNPGAPRVVGDPPGNPLCFVAYEVKRPFVELGNGIKLPSNPPLPSYQNGLTLRERFMGLRTEEQFLKFLNQFGRFSPLAEAERTYGWQMRDLVGCQEMFSELAKRSPETWNEYANSLISPKSSVPQGIVAAVVSSSEHEIEFRWKGSPQRDWMGARNIGMIKANNVVEAILTTIEVDHLRGTQLKGCARPDCKQFFEPTSNHKRIYCTQYCAHLESLRRMRKRQKSKRVKPTKSV
jgi:hypothetical protein